MLLERRNTRLNDLITWRHIYFENQMFSRHKNLLNEEEFSKKTQTKLKYHIVTRENTLLIYVM